MDHSSLALILIAVYFLPWIVASVREKRNKAAIGLFNLFFGWAIVGWAVALIWSAMKDQPSPSQ
jgi:hypothetical protein